MELDARLDGAWPLLGIAHREMGNLDSAKFAFWKALELNPNDFDANIQLGSLALIDRELKEAETLIRRALDVRPSSLAARYQWALLLVAQQKAAEAVSELESIRAAAPDWREPHLRLATLYYQLNRPADGQKEREIVEKLDAASQKDALRRLSDPAAAVSPAPSPSLPGPEPRF
jgi:Flp pilus assembly protein TadD